MSVVYFIQAGKEGPIKIGWADDAKKRAGDLQCGSPVRLNVLATVAGGHKIERALHRHFRPWRVGREWFRDAHPITTLVAKIQRGEIADGTAAVEWAKPAVERYLRAEDEYCHINRVTAWRRALVDPMTPKAKRGILKWALANQGETLEPRPLTLRQALLLSPLLEDEAAGRDEEIRANRMTLENASAAIDALLARVGPKGARA